MGAGLLSENLEHPSAAAQGRVVGFGHSHLSALQFAYADWIASHPKRSLDIEFIQLLSGEYKLSDTLFDYDRLIIKITEIADHGSDLVPFVFTCFSGNDYHVISMVRHPQPFDFVLAEQPSLPMQQGVQVLPSEAIESTLAQSIQPAIEQMTAIRRRIPFRMVAISSPPPIADNGYLNGPQNAFWDKAQTLGISPPAFRWKVWRLQCLAYERGCAEAGITYLSPPEGAMTEDGFMRPEGWHSDGVHGSAWYGALVLDQLANLL